MRCGARNDLRFTLKPPTLAQSRVPTMSTNHARDAYELSAIAPSAAWPLLSRTSRQT